MKAITSFEFYFNNECKNVNFKNNNYRFARIFSKPICKIAEEINGKEFVLNYNLNDKYKVTSNAIVCPSAIVIHINYKKVCRAREKFFAAAKEYVASIDDSLVVRTWGDNNGIILVIDNWNDELVEALCEKYKPTETVVAETVETNEAFQDFADVLDDLQYMDNIITMCVGNINGLEIDRNVNLADINEEIEDKACLIAISADPTNCKTSYMPDHITFDITEFWFKMLDGVVEILNNTFPQYDFDVEYGSDVQDHFTIYYSRK